MSDKIPLLRALGVTISRPDEAEKLQPLLQEVSLEVSAGEVLVIIGPSGSGKSTLLRLFNRLLQPECGEILLNNEDIQEIPPSELRARISLVTQKPFLFPGSVRDNLLMSSRFTRSNPPDLDSARGRELLELCQVDSAWLDRNARKLSVGQQQRVCLARALVGPCQVILLDEPTSALDRPTSDLLAQTFRQLARQRQLAVVCVTHDIRLAERCADRVAILLDGRIVETGTAEQLLHNPQSPEARDFLSMEPERARRARS